MAIDVTAPSANESLLAWVSDAISLCEPDDVHWCDGSTEEYERLCGLLVETGTFERLSEELRPNSYLARSHPGDVARVEDRTFICSEAESDAGPTNNWRDPRMMRSLLRERFSGAMRGRTMYVVPFSMGPLGSPASRLGVQLTDSAYAVVSMRLMTRMGIPALEELGADFVPCLHTVGAPGDASPWPCDDDKYIVHFPETREIWSYGSGYGGNALLRKKCLALRIASVMARDEGWLAEHMLILKLTSPERRVKHRPAAHPNARFTVAAAQAPTMAPEWEDPAGVPIDAIVFGGRRSTVVPLVQEAYDWEHGIFLGSIMGSETTAAAEGARGRLRRDPFAMLPFCGYDMGDYFRHWLRMGRREGASLPRIFSVNWFRKSDARWLWPGFGENARVLEWIHRRCDHTVPAVEEPIGLVPPPGGLNVEGLPIGAGDLDELLRVDPDEWLQEIGPIRDFYAALGDSLPIELQSQLTMLERRLREA